MNKNESLFYLDLATYDINAFDEKEKEILARINRKVAGGESLKEIIDFVFHETQTIMPCDRIGIGFIEEDYTRLTLYYVVTSYDEIILNEGYSADIKRSSLAPLFDKGNPRIINNLKKYFEKNPSSKSTEMLVKEGVMSSMTCPLLVEGRRIGLLFRSSRKPDAYTDRHVGLHLAMAERLSQAVEKAYRIEQVTRNFNSYMEILGFVTHELKSPLSSIITLGQTLTSGYFGDVNEKHKELIERMLKKAEYLLNLSKEYLNLARFESGKLEPAIRETNFVEIIVHDAIDLLKPQIDEKNMSLETDLPDKDIAVECDRGLMRIVLVNLISNAVKYGNTNGKVKITVRTLKEPDAHDSFPAPIHLAVPLLHVSVWNEGTGFSEEEKKLLFKKFSRLKRKELAEKKGTGIGLYMSWKTIQIHKGVIRAESDPGKWADFSFQIPLKYSISDST